MKFTIGSLFSGIGGLDLAAHWAGLQTAWFVEKEPFCQKVLAKHWPDVPIFDDVFDVSYPPHVDVIVGGFPCQPFSVAGNQRGRNDERFLLPEMLRIVDEVKPYAVLFENVPGFPSLNDGAEFKYLLGALAEMGFDAEWGHPRAKDASATHARQRWFLVAYTNSSGRTKQTYKRGSFNSKRDLQTNQRSREQISIAPSGERAGIRKNITQRFESRLGRFNDGLPGRLDFVGFPARPGEPQHAYEPPRTAPSTPTTNARIKALGNAVVPQVAYPIFQSIYEWLEEVK